MLEKEFTYIGAITSFVIVGLVIYIIVRAIGTFIKRNMHRHSYQIHHMLSMHHKERNCDDITVCLQCERCGKIKYFRFWNDRVTIQAVSDRGEG